MSSPYVTEACVRNKRKDKDLEKELGEIARKKDRSLKDLHLQTVELMKQKDRLDHSMCSEKYDITMHLDDLALYNKQRNAEIKDRKRSKMDPYSNLTMEPVDKMPVPKSRFVDSAGVVESCNGQLLKAKKMLLKYDFHWVHSTSGEHYQMRRLMDD